MNAEKIEDAERAVTEAKEAYLAAYGWRQTCNTPGALWLWWRDFGDIDAERLAWWEETCAKKPPLGNPSKPAPYGRMTVPLDVAVRMTQAALEK